MTDQRHPSGVTRGRKSRGAIYRMLQEGVTELGTRLGGLPSPAEAEDIWGDIWYQEAHNSTALEGNTLALRQVEVLLRDGRAVGGERLAEYLEVQGYAEAARWVYGQALEPGGWAGDALLTLAEVRQVHHMAMQPVWEVAPHPNSGPDEGPGNFRRHNIQAFPGGMRPPDWTEVPPLVGDWIESVNQLPQDGRPLSEALAERHARFEQIHPFIDGNGRTGRLLTNLVLIRLGYPPAIIRKRQRSRYLRALQKADGGDMGPLGELLAREILDTLQRFVVPAVAGAARLVALASLADAELSPEALREAIKRGRLKAQQDASGRWLSSRVWVEEYKASRSPRGRRRR
jgi:Fic family protein